MIVAITGHRPNQCENEGVVRIKCRVKLQYTKEVTTVITGMAEGVDLWAADEARKLGLDVWSARPWTGHKVSKDWQGIYEQVLDCASKIVVVTEADTYPGHWVMHKRNQWMVDNADVVMAYMNPEKESGGTFQCVKYAKSKNKPVANIYLDPPF